MAGRARKNGKKPEGWKPCGAPRGRNGEPCLRDAGWGTDHLGSGRCKNHGGALPNGDEVAARERVAGLIPNIKVNPDKAIGVCLNQAAGYMSIYGQEVAQLDQKEIVDEDGNVNVWIRLHQREMDRVAKYSVAASQMGINERSVKLAEAQTVMMGELVARVINQLGLTEAQRKKVGPAIRENLALIEGEAREKVGA